MINDIGFHSSEDTIKPYTPQHDIKLLRERIEKLETENKRLRQIEAAAKEAAENFTETLSILNFRINKNS
jgi:hypothetical protein